MPVVSFDSVPFSKVICFSEMTIPQSVHTVSPFGSSKITDIDLHGLQTCCEIDLLASTTVLSSFC